MFSWCMLHGSVKSLVCARRFINAIDVKIIKLLQRRFKIVEGVRLLKKKSYRDCDGGFLFIKPLREALIVKQRRDSVAANKMGMRAMWRSIILSANHIEQNNFTVIFAYGDKVDYEGCLNVAAEYPFGVSPRRFEEIDFCVQKPCVFAIRAENIGYALGKNNKLRVFGRLDGGILLLGELESDVKFEMLEFGCVVGIVANLRIEVFFRPDSDDTLNIGVSNICDDIRSVILECYIGDAVVCDKITVLNITKNDFDRLVKIQNVLGFAVRD